MAPSSSLTRELLQEVYKLPAFGLPSQARPKPLMPTLISESPSMSLMEKLPSALQDVVTAQQESAQPAPQATPLTLMLQFATPVDSDAPSAVLPTLTHARLAMTASISQEHPAFLVMPHA